jgi:uncharacterized membrane protein
MSALSQAVTPLLASFLACLVECVEALTVVLAIGSVRGWRDALLGVATALALLLLLVVVLGRSLALVPLQGIQLIVGGLLLLFGLRWLRKAILRAAGIIALHDETQAYQRMRERARQGQPQARLPFDLIAYLGSCKIVLLEGVEVVFIVVAIATNSGAWWPATSAAIAAVLLVAALGVVLHRPLARIPENALKFAVACALCAFGSYWLGEGLRFDWPWRDWTLPALLAGFAGLALVLVLFARRPHRTALQAVQGHPPPRLSPALVRVVGPLWDLFIDDAWLALGASAWTLTLYYAADLLPEVPGVRAAALIVGIAIVLTQRTLNAAHRGPRLTA